MTKRSSSTARARVAAQNKKKEQERKVRQQRRDAALVKKRKMSLSVVSTSGDDSEIKSESDVEIEAKVASLKIKTIHVLPYSASKKVKGHVQTNRKASSVINDPWFGIKLAFAMLCMAAAVYYFQDEIMAFYSLFFEQEQSNQSFLDNALVESHKRAKNRWFSDLCKPAMVRSPWQERLEQDYCCELDRHVEYDTIFDVEKGSMISKVGINAGMKELFEPFIALLSKAHNNAVVQKDNANIIAKLAKCYGVLEMTIM